MANNEGGKILIGYHEKENTFIGIEKDGFLNVDEWELNLRNRIKEKAGEFVQTLLNVEYLKYEDGVTCALINVENSEEDIMCKQQNSNKKEFYLRKGARTAALDIEEYSKHKAQKEIN